MERSYDAEDLGPANRATSIASGALAGETLYVGSRVIRPAVVGVFDVRNREVRENVRIEVTGRGSLSIWSLQAINDGRDLFVGVSGDGTLHHVDTETGESTLVADLPDCSFVWDIAADETDDTLYLGTYPDSVVFSYDCITGEVENLGPAVDSEDYAHSIASTPDGLYIGVHSHAHLIHMDPATGTRTDVLPDEFAGMVGVRPVVTTDEYVVAAVSDSERNVLVVLDGETHQMEAVTELPEANVGAAFGLALEGHTAYCCGDALYQYDIQADSFTRLASVGGAELFIVDTTLVGAGDPFWTYDLGTGSLDRMADRMETVGLASGSQQGQSIAYLDGAVYAGGSSQTTRLDPETGDRIRLHHRGEAKCTETIEGVLYQGIYPGAFIARYDPNRDDDPVVTARVGHEQHRPRGCHYHDANGDLFIGTKPDYGKLGGALVAYDPDDDEIRTVERNIDPDQTITAIASARDTLYLSTSVSGGLGVDPVAERAVLAGVDATRLKSRWQTSLDGTTSITDVIAPAERRLYGLTTDGVFFEFDLVAREITRWERLSDGRGDGGGTLLCEDGTIYGATAECLFAYDPDGRTIDVLWDELHGDWHSTPSVAAGDGWVYVLENRNIRRVASR